jgi:hypothetical protein
MEKNFSSRNFSLALKIFARICLVDIVLPANKLSHEKLRFQKRKALNMKFETICFKILIKYLCFYTRFVLMLHDQSSYMHFVSNIYNT